MDSETNSNDRRTFIQQMLGAGVAVAGSGLLSGCASAGSAVGAQQAGAQQAGAPPAGTRTATAGASEATTAAATQASAAQASAGGRGQPAPIVWDMSWQKKLGKYKTVYDSAQIEDGAALSYAASAAAGYKAALNVSTPEFTPVIVFRHLGTIMALNDSMWDRVSAGAQYKLKDPTTGEPDAKRNPFLTYEKGDKSAYIGADSSIAAIMAAGGIILACNRALTRLAGQLRNKETGKYATTDLALQEIHRNLIPGVYVMPNGIFAMSAAQDAGCHYMRVIV